MQKNVLLDIIYIFFFQIYKYNFSRNKIIFLNLKKNNTHEF